MQRGGAGGGNGSFLSGHRLALSGDCLLLGGLLGEGGAKRKLGRFDIFLRHETFTEQCLLAGQCLL